jgi:hypothetical protein
MPIRINLLAETVAAEEMRRRDPVKRVLLFGGLLVLVMLVWSSYIWLRNVMARSNLSQKQATIERQSKEYKSVLEDLKKVDAVQARVDSLEKLRTNRFLQGNLLDALQHVTVPDVQLTRLSLTQTYVKDEAKKVPAGKIPGPPTAAVEKATLLLDLKDYSSNPGDGVNRFKDALTDQSFLQSILDTTNGVRLSGVTGVQKAADGKSYEIFTLECRFNDIRR